MTNYKCKDCGNTEYFDAEGRETQRVTEEYVATFTIDNEGSVEDSETTECIDSFDHDTLDSDIDWDTLKCHICGSDNVVDLDEELELTSWKSRLIEPKAL